MTPDLEAILQSEHFERMWNHVKEEEKKEVVKPWTWHEGPKYATCDDCGGEVWFFKEGAICTKCKRGD